MNRELKFDLLKRVAGEHAASQVAPRGWDSDPTIVMLHVRAVLRDGYRSSLREFVKELQDRVRRQVDAFDVRMAGELLRFVPKGADGRIPAWVYSGFTAELGESGWVLVER